MTNRNIPTWPSYTCQEVEAAAQVLFSNKVNYWTGEECRKFETEFAAWAGTKYAIALANGTVALELALKALNVGVGDEVIVTPRSYIASVSCVINCGATPVFADVDRESGNISASTIESVLSERTRAIICVHLAGLPCDMDKIIDLANRYNLKVIEDCAQAHGARYRGRSVGSIGNVGAWSFCQDKIITTAGEGGMITTSDKEVWNKIWSLKDHGKSYSAVYEQDHPAGFKWLHESFGTNARMLEIQAAIGRIQLKLLPEWSATRKRNASILSDILKPFSGPTGCIRLISPHEDDIITHANYKFYAYVKPECLKEGWSRDRIVSAMVDIGVPCYQGTCPEIYLEKAFDTISWRPKERLPVARELGETSIMFLVHPTLTDDHMTGWGRLIKQVLAIAQL